MKKWFRFEILYKKSNPFSFESKSKIYTNWQIAYCEDIHEAKEKAINSFNLERFGDDIISIRHIDD
jgi:hypothetical protein